MDTIKARFVIDHEVSFDIKHRLKGDIFINIAVCMTSRLKLKVIGCIMYIYIYKNKLNFI